MTPQYPPSAHIDLADALAQSATQRSAQQFRRGTLRVTLYAPRGTDPQTAHAQDEAYVVARGRGTFWDGEQRWPVEPGTFLFAEAGRPHRFEDFSDDFCVWVIFFGPEGGERPGARL